MTGGEKGALRGEGSRFGWGTLFSLVFACVCVVPCCNSKKNEATKLLPFDMYFTCDTNGRIEPCGCFTGQYGGLTRVSTVLRKAPASALKVEIGNAIAGLEDYHIIQYRHLLDACGAMGYAAVNLGERESRLPAAAIRDLSAKSPVPLLAANVLDSATKEPLVARSVVVDHGSLKVGIVGVVDPDSVDGHTDASVVLGGMNEALRAAVEALKGKTQVLVCLAFTNENGLEKLADEFYEFDLVLGGDVRQPSSALARVNQSFILATTNQARALGEVHANYDTESDRLTAATGDVRLMVDTIREDPEIQQFSARYRDQIRDTLLAVDSPAGQEQNRIPGVEQVAKFVGSSNCASCHPKAFDVWSKSGHAHAFDSLVRKNSDADPSCISCHVVGFREPGGYMRTTRAEHLRGVGCESCHGPGSEHVRLRLAAKPGEEILMKMRPVGQGQCIQCHYGEFSRPFDFETFWPDIDHGKQ